MAIIDHFEVTILIDSEVAKEYDDPEAKGQPDNHKAGTKYIEVTSGSPFASNLKVLPSYRAGEADGLGFYITVGGRRASGNVCEKKKISRITDWTTTKHAQYTECGTDAQVYRSRCSELANDCR